MHKLTKKEILEIKDNDKINNFLFDKVYELGEKIIKLKKFKYEVLYENDKNMELFCMSDFIYYESVWFDSFRFLADKVMYNEPVNNINYIIKSYNEILKEYREYKQKKKRIEEIGYEKLYTELTNNLKELFCEMLDFKKIKYNKDDSLNDLIDKLVLCYVDYKYMFDEVYTMLRGIIYKDTVRDDFWLVHADHVEIINSLEYTYHFFKDDPDNYKNYTKYSEDIILKEGQTLKDKYSEEEEKMRLLFLEMLRFLNIEVNDDDSYYHLKSLVEQNYPFYYYSLIRDVHEYSYVNLIGILRSNYEHFKNTYKNHDELLEIHKKHYEDDDEEIDDYEIELIDDEEYE